MKFLGKAAVAIALVVGAGGAAAPASAQQIARLPPLCDRGCLENMAEQFLKALAAHNPRSPAIASNARYTENSVELKMPDGLWRTISGVKPYRLYIADPQERTIAFYAKILENGAPAYMTSRLEVNDGKITKIETMVARQAGIGSPPPANGNWVQDQLGDKPRAQFLQTLAPSERRSREEMVFIANSYFSALELNDGTKKVPFAPTCHRLENGRPTTNNPVPAGGTRSAGNMGCTEGFASGFFRIDTRLQHRRYLAIDEERGLVYARVLFDHDSSFKEYRTPDGQLRQARMTAPWSWDIAEVFQIKNGMIDQVEALLVNNPYGMNPGWDDGVKMPSFGY